MGRRASHRLPDYRARFFALKKWRAAAMDGRAMRSAMPCKASLKSGEPRKHKKPDYRVTNAGE
ncbi:hypothetical protein WS62_18100 [Burkholderia sp. ABCPW 14]|nr:hypothetical protein WS62_18100 [Burkholderia sp. ABCPW 14]